MSNGVDKNKPITVTKTEFLEKFKLKYPDYANDDNAKLWDALIKSPEFGPQIDAYNIKKDAEDYFGDWAANEIATSDSGVIENQFVDPVKYPDNPNLAVVDWIQGKPNNQETYKYTKPDNRLMLYKEVVDNDVNINPKGGQPAYPDFNHMMNDSEMRWMIWATLDKQGVGVGAYEDFEEKYKGDKEHTPFDWDAYMLREADKNADAIENISAMQSTMKHHPKPNYSALSRNEGDTFGEFIFENHYSRLMKKETIGLVSNMVQMSGELSTIALKNMILNPKMDTGLKLIEKFQGASDKDIEERRSSFTKAIASQNIYNQWTDKVHKVYDYALDTGSEFQVEADEISWDNWYTPHVMAETFSKAIPSLMMIMAGGPAGTPGIAGTVMLQTSAGFYDEALKKGVDEDQAMTTALIVGGFSGLIGTWRYKPLMDKLGVGGKNIMSNVFMKKVVEKGFLKSTSKEMFRQGLFEALEETGQEAIAITGEMSYGDIPTWTELGNRLLVSAYSGQIAGTPLGGVSGTIQYDQAIKYDKINKDLSAVINTVTPDRITYDIADDNVKIDLDGLSKEEKEFIENSGLEGRLKVKELQKNWPDVPLEIAVMMELNKNSKWFQDVDFDIQTDVDMLEVFTPEQLITMGYWDYETRFKESEIKEGDEEYESRKLKYKLRVRGKHSYNEATKRTRISLYRGATKSTVTEEQVEHVYKGLEKSNPELFQKINSFLDNARVVFESNGFNAPNNVEFFSKIMTFNVMGNFEFDTELTTMASLPEGLKQEFLAEFGQQSDGSNLSFLYYGGKPKEGIIPQEIIEEYGQFEQEVDTDTDQDRAPPEVEEEPITEESNLIEVYHGSTEPSSREIGGSIFTTRDKAQAEMYGENVNSFMIDESKLAPDDVVRNKIIELGYSIEGWDISIEGRNELMMHEIIDPNFDTSLKPAEIAELYSQLEKDGYIGIKVDDIDLKTDKPTIENVLLFKGEQHLKGETSFQITGYHGSGVEFEQFNSGKTVNAMYGYGVYTTPHKKIAARYADKQDRPDKNLIYHLTIHKGKKPSEYDYLDWSNAIEASQLEKIKKQLNAEGLSSALFTSRATGENVYNLIKDQIQSDIMGDSSEGFGLDNYSGDADRLTSAFLLRAGIDGNKVGTSVFVTFDDKAINIDEVEDVSDSFQLTGEEAIADRFNESNVSNTEKIVADKLDINIVKDKRVPGGSTRDVYNINGKVVKVAKNPRGLEQNNSIGWGDEDILGTNIPKLYEVGKDYIVVENVPRNDKEVRKFLKPLQKFTVEDWNNKTGELQDVLREMGLEGFMNYEVLWNDFKAYRNWGQRENGEFVLVDEGALNKNITFNSKIPDWAKDDWKEILGLRREAKKTTKESFQLTGEEIDNAVGADKDMIDLSEGVIFIGGDAVSVDMDGNPHESGYTYPEKYIEQGSGWQLSQAGATNIERMAAQGNKTIAVVVYPNLQPAMKFNPIYQAELTRRSIKIVGKRAWNKALKETKIEYEKKTKSQKGNTTPVQMAAVKILPYGSLVKTAEDIAAPEFDKDAGMIVGVGRFHKTALGDERVIKHEVYEAEVQMKNYQRLPKPIPFGEFKESIKKFSEGQKAGAWLTMRNVSFWLNKDDSKLIPKLIEAGEGDLSLLQKDIEKGVPSYQLTGTDIDKIYEGVDGKKVPKVIDKKANWWTEYIIPLSTRINDISPNLHTRMRRFEFDYATRTNNQKAQVKAFVEKFSSLKDIDRQKLDLALKNGDTSTIMDIVNRTGMYAEYLAVQKVLDNIFMEANDAGMDIGYLQGYFPRKVISVPALLDHLGADNRGIFEQAIKDKSDELGRELDDTEKANIINSMIGRGQIPSTTAAPDPTKKRKINTIDKDLNQFYQSTEKTLLNYIDGMNQAILTNQLFGKGDEAGSSLGDFLAKMVEDGEITNEQQTEIAQILNARFNSAPSRSWVAPTKNVLYAMTMGSPTSTVTQIGDLAWALYKGGVYTPKALIKSTIGQSNITLEDVGIEQISQEFQSDGAGGFTQLTYDGLNKLFTMTGLTKIDKIGKETLMNSAVDKFRKQAKRGDKKFRKEIDHIFGSRADQVWQSLIDGDMNEDIQFLAFNTLSDFQPVSLLELPQGYVENTGGRARIFYQLKTFTIKQLDVFRNEGIRKIQTGKPEQVKEGLSNLIKLAVLFSLTQSGASLIKDWMMGRDIELDDYAWSSLFRLFGLSRYNYYRFKEEPVKGVGEVLISTPFIGVFGDAVEDFKTLYDAATDSDEKEESQKDFFDELKNIRTAQRVPFVGKLMYWHYGGGNKKMNTRALEEYKKMSKEKRLSDAERFEYQELMNEALEFGYIRKSQWDLHNMYKQGAYFDPMHGKDIENK